MEPSYDVLDLFHIDMKGGAEESLEELMMKEYSYPSPDDEHFQTAIYRKRDFNVHQIPYRGKLTSYEEIEKFRKEKCSPQQFQLSEQQLIVTNFINPNTPYKGLLGYWGTGVGKTGMSISAAENFKPMVEKYGTKIHVLVHGPIQKENYLNEILKFMHKVYFKDIQNDTVLQTEEQKQRARKAAIAMVNQYYRIMSYKSFYKKVLGEKIRDKTMVGNKVRVKNRKNQQGEYEREMSADRIFHLNNTLLIVDEAHNITNNGYGMAVERIIRTSTNLKILLLTATSMKNLADDSIFLINLMRPANAPIRREQIYTSPRGYNMEFKPEGKEIFRRMIRGYISFMRGADPMTFAERIDIGEIPSGLSFTKVTRCMMESFQLQAYNSVSQSSVDSLGKRSEAIANFAIPGFAKDKSNTIVAYSGISGIFEVTNQVKSKGKALCERIAATILSQYDIENVHRLLILEEGGHTLSGDIFQERYLNVFSSKFYRTLININQMYTGEGGRGHGLIFIYSNLVRAGIELFRQVMLNNDYLEYDDKREYNLTDTTRCYFCNVRYGQHNHLPSDVPTHDFYPATFISVTGKTEDTSQPISDEKYNIIKNVYNSNENKHGKLIKFILGSKIMGEGVTLYNIREIHILDVYYNLGRVDQVMGRGMRYCTHYALTNRNNVFPKVEIYKYVIGLAGELSSEERMYQKAEQKYMLIKETEMIMKEEAIDCPLLRNGNVFPEEREKYANCGTPDNPCPGICGYLPCDFKCGDRLLNDLYYDANRHIYRKLAKHELDYTTYTKDLAYEEIEFARQHIANMYSVDTLYTLQEITDYVKSQYAENKRDIFDEFYVHQALNDYIPITSNDFNNMERILFNKYNVPGYLIFRHSFYIFQPFDENEDLPMIYRKSAPAIAPQSLSVENYVKNIEPLRQVEMDQTPIENVNMYDFDTGQEYYKQREENDHVGIIDRNTARVKNQTLQEITDEFKIRPRREKDPAKNRQAGLPSYKGAICDTAKSVHYLRNVASSIQLHTEDLKTRSSICSLIRRKMMDMEYYSKGANKRTTMIVPYNHDTLPWPLNIEDRSHMIVQRIEHETHTKLQVQMKDTARKGEFKDIKYYTRQIIIRTPLEHHAALLKSLGGTFKNNEWIIPVGLYRL